MPYDLTDPRQADLVRQKALARGIDPNEVEKAIKKATQQQYVRTRGYSPTGKVAETGSGLDLYEQQLNVKKKELELDSLVKKQGTGSGIEMKDEFGRKMLNARTASLEALKLLESGVSTGPIATRLQQVGEFFGKTGEGTDYRSALNLAASQAFNALAGTTQSPAELKRLEKLVPKDTDQEEVAKRKLNKIIEMLDKQMEIQGTDISSLEQPGLGLQEESASGLGLDIEKKNVPQPIEKNINGQIAGIGDLVRDESGKMKIMGDVADDPLFKQSKELGFRVDNSLIRFLADSEFLPIAGSVAGGLLGGIAGGAGGAMVGKGSQQAMKELLDPDAQDLSDHGRVILTEGVVDAVFSGLTLGIGKVGGKALGLVLKESGEEVVEQVGKQAVEEVGEKVIKEGGVRVPGIGSQEDLLRKGYAIPLNEKAAFTEKHGTSIYNKIIQFLDGDLSKLTDPESAAKLASEQMEKAGKEISEKIAGRAVKADLVIDPIEDIIEGIKKPLITGGEKKTIEGVLDIASLGKNKKMVVPSEYQAGVTRLEEKIKFLKSFAKENNGYVPLEEVQLMKKELSDAFRGVAEEQSAKKLVQKGYGTLMGTIEKYGGEGVKESNLKYYVFDLLQESAIKADEKVIRQAFDAIDIVVGIGTAGATGGNIPATVAATGFIRLLRNFQKEPLKQLKLVNKIGQYSVEKGNKNALRGLILAVQKLGIPMGISETLIKQVGKESAKALTQPGLDLGSDEENHFLYR